MILDFGTGYHDAQVQYMGLGWGVTLVSGDSQSGTTLIGRWFDPIIVRADTGPITARADTKVGL